MILNCIIIGKFSVSFHDIIFLGFHNFLFVSLFRSSLFIFLNQILPGKEILRYIPSSSPVKLLSLEA